MRPFHKKIRNFVIISHIDHGKSTLADRFLEITGTVPKSKIKEQYLDTLEQERNHGITIKLHPVQLVYQSPQTLNPKSEILNNSEYILNLIDTPGHVDFSYEVERALSCVEGAVLLVDAAKGIQAQTLANFYLAKEKKLKIIPVINKIDLENARIEEVKKEIKNLGLNEEIYLISAKTGQNVEKVLEAIIEKIPCPSLSENSDSFKALVFDSVYDSCKGIIVFIRVFNGQIKAKQKILFLENSLETKLLEVGLFKPELSPSGELSAGEIGYLATGSKEPRLLIGETIVIANVSGPKPIGYENYEKPCPKVFAGFYPKNKDFLKLERAMKELQLNDPSLVFSREKTGLGQGLKSGFLGALHLKITKERLEQGFNMPITSTLAHSLYKIVLRNGQDKIIDSMKDYPEEQNIEAIEEPWIKMEIISPYQYLSSIIKLIKDNAGKFLNSRIFESKAVSYFEFPYPEFLSSFFDKIKTLSSGYATLNYEFIGFRKQRELVKIDIMVEGKKVDYLSFICPKDRAQYRAREILLKVKKNLSRKLFEISLQAGIGSRIIAKEKIPALRKDVLAKLYGGDRTRKDKLLKKQKRGKKKLKEIGGGIDPAPLL